MARIAIYWSNLLVLAITIHNGMAGLLVGDVNQCESTCASTYANKEESSRTICQQGCRLMSIGDFMALGTGKLDDLRDSCLQSCKEAYSGNDEQSACGFGCQSQLPSVERHRQHFNSYYQQQMEMASAMSGLHDYYSRMMDCLMDHIDHQFGFGLRLPVSGSGQTGQLTVIISGGGVNGEPFFEGLVSAEQKTSSFLETNLVSVDRAATPNIKGVIGQGESALMSLSVQSSESFDEKRLATGSSDSDLNWMFCIERTGTSKKLVLVMIVVSLLVIVLCVCTGTTAPSQPYWPEKLSINGDLDYLKELGNDQFLISTKPQEPVWSAGPLPLKIPVQSV